MHRQATFILSLIAAVIAIELGTPSAQAAGSCPIGTVLCNGVCVPEVDNCGQCGKSCNDGNLLTVDACESGIRCIHTPPARQTCQSCDVSSSADGTNVFEIGRTESNFDGTDTTFTYRVCAVTGDLSIDSWMLALSDACCDRLVGVAGGSSTDPTCVYDANTGLRGVRFIVPPGDSAACDAFSPVCGASPGGGTFEITLAGRVPSGCVLYGATLSTLWTPSIPSLGQIVGPDCGDFCDPRTLFDANGDTCVDLKDASLFLDTFTGPCLPPIDCVVSGFGPFSQCSAECGSGTSCRSRVVMQEPSNGGAACPPLEECVECNTQLCPVDCVVSGWGPFSSCSAACGGGTSCRSRVVLQEPANGGVACPTLDDCRECNTQVCDVDCVVSAWSDFSQCSAMCDGGTSCRTRIILQQPSGNGVACPPLQDCVTCNTQPCDICLLPADVGPCDAVISRWYFEPKIGDCLGFIWGGCGGNENNFVTYDACIAACPAP